MLPTQPVTRLPYRTNILPRVTIHQPSSIITTATTTTNASSAVGVEGSPGVKEASPAGKKHDGQGQNDTQIQGEGQREPGAVTPRCPQHWLRQVPVPVPRTPHPLALGGTLSPPL